MGLSACIGNSMPAEGVALLGPVYQVTASDMQGNDIATLNAPMMLQIPYDAAVLSAAGLTPDDIQVAYFNPDVDGWMLLDGYIVDQTAGQVIVSAEALGGYGLISVTSYGKTALPIMRR